jgi:hypothetical protein
MPPLLLLPVSETEGDRAAEGESLFDAEGAETAVLRGFGGHLAGPALRRIVFEAANDFLITHEPADLYTLITEAGFSVSILTRRERTSHRLSNFVAIRG